MGHELELKIYCDRFPDMYKNTYDKAERNIDEIINDIRKSWSKLNSEHRRLRGFVIVKISDPLAHEVRETMFKGVLHNMDSSLGSFPYFQAEKVKMRFFDNSERYSVKTEAFIVDVEHPDDATIAGLLIDV